MRFYAKNPGDKEFRFDSRDWDGEWPQLVSRLEHRKMDITVPNRVPVLQGAIIWAEDQGRTKFRGYVEFEPEANGSRKTLLCVGDEKRLNEISLAPYVYTSSDVTLGQLLSNTLTDGAVPGLFAALNSTVPAGWEYTIHDAVKNIVKLAGLGTTSRWERPSMFVSNYIGVRAVSRYPLLSNLQSVDNSYFQDEDDLYIRISTDEFESNWYDMGGLFFQNMFDTGCRSRKITHAESTMDGDLEITDESKPGDQIVGIARGHGRYTHVESDRNHTYFDFSDEEGRGGPGGLISIEESRCRKMERDAARDYKANSLTGRGYGYQYHTPVDLEWRGPWAAATKDIVNAFKDAEGNLRSRAAEEFGERQVDHQWKATTYQRLSVLPGDFIRVVPRIYPAEVLNIGTIKLNSENETILILGPPKAKYFDAWEALNEVEGYTDRTLWPSSVPITQSTTFYPYDTEHDGTTASLSFTVKDNVKAALNRARITMDVSLSYNTDKVPIPQRALLVLTVGGVRIAPIQTIKIGSTIKSIDITDRVTQGAANLVTAKAYFAEECDGTHSDYTGHTMLSISVTMNFWRRAKLS